MHSAKSFFSAVSLASFLTLSALVFAPALEASGWGKTNKVSQYEGTAWNGVYFDLENLNLKASIPNYSGGQFQNGDVFLRGIIESDDAGYVIMSSYNAGFAPPKTLEKFVKMIQDANPEHLVNAVDANKFGALYVVDLIPVDHTDSNFWRFLSSEDRLIRMGTDDSNEHRRINFFESVYIKKH